ncbi:MAG TPA: GNAT family N-acetyltransferase [Candidatus Angelobacter sp.]|nr:GNAT family N-acetyltransferase [Candidatus Angelobacter sp.]
MNISRRPVRPDDQEFQFKLYATTRQAEIAGFGWNSAQQEAFLRTQFAAQQNWYRTAYPQAVWEIIELDQTPVGRMIVHRTKDFITLVDIALLSEHRSGGIGGGLVRELVEQGRKAMIPVRLQVLKSNPAARLYERLGFAKTGEDQMYLQMEKTPG